MTTMFEVEKICSECGRASKHRACASTYNYGSPDLDTRPPEMSRSTINTWISTCPACGYCAPDISEQIEKASEIIHSDAYQRQLNDLESPKLANAFICYSIIKQSLGEFAEASWASIHAAWVCDDNGSDVGSKVFRARAVTLQQMAKDKGQILTEQAGAEEAIMVDLLRRSGQFDYALKFCEYQKAPFGD